MSGCEGCFESAKGQAIELDNAIKRATEYARDKKISVAIIKESGEYQFCEAFYAFSHGYAVTKVVSYYSATTAQ